MMLSDAARLVSKVLVLEGSAACHARIKTFCEDNGLVGLKAQDDNVMSILRSNIDLGGVFIDEDHGAPGGGLAFGREIHSVRPELPIFLRRAARGGLDDLPEPDRRIFRAGYTADAMDALREAVAQSIFSLVYPNALVRGVAEITIAALESQFKDVSVQVEAPCLVRDRLIYGELFSLIPLESTWCRGYMMLQAAEQPLMDFVRAEKTFAAAEDAGFRDINNVLGEVTNLVWGSFKNRFVSHTAPQGHLTQVPIIVNHLHRYISFGSEDPQLCFKYTLTDSQGREPASVEIHQRFVFNLSWSPDNFAENEACVEDLFESGELELF